MDPMDVQGNPQTRGSEQDLRFLTLYSVLFHAVLQALGLLEAGRTAEAALLLREAQLQAADIFLWGVSQRREPDRRPPARDGVPG